METKKQFPLVLKLKDPTLLPSACFATMFMGTRVLYKGKLLASSIVPNLKNQLVRTIKVGDFLYVAQEQFEDSKWAELARAGHKILWIVHQPTSKVIGKVINGKVTRL